MGHCLWTGIVDEEKAEPVARRLVSDAMFSGWGVRTLSTDTHGYNPISYHCGSVWPHDNAIIAAGLMRYGFVEEAHRVMRGLVEASPWFGDLLPEPLSLASGFVLGERIFIVGGRVNSENLSAAVRSTTVAPDGSLETFEEHEPLPEPREAVSVAVEVLVRR